MASHPPTTETAAGTRPARWISRLWALAGTLSAVAGLSAAASGYFAWQGRFWVSGQSVREVILWRPPLWVALLVGLALAGLFIHELRGAEGTEEDRRARRLALKLSVWLLAVPPYALLSPVLGLAGPARFFLWRVAEGLAVLGALAATAHAGLTLRRPFRPPAWLVGPRLWLLCFVCAHAPGLWLIRPWEPRFQQHRFIGGDEPEILLLTHSMAMDSDFNLYNNRQHNDRRRYLLPSEDNMDGTAEDAARKVQRLGARAPYNTPDYWAKRRYNMYRPGLGLLLAPGYKLGFQWGKHHFYGVVLTLALMLTVTMVNIHALVLRATASRGAALLAAFVSGLSPPLLFFSVSVYPDPLCAALLVFAIRILYDAWRNRRDHGVRPSWKACAAFAFAAAYLPGIHEKMLGFSALLLLAFFLLARPAPRGALIVLGLTAISALLQSAYYRTVYGVWLPPYIHKEPFRLSHLQAGALGMLLDRNRGLAPMMPWCWAGFAGLILWLRRERSFAWLPALLIIGFWVATGSFLGWYGGACPQPRYVTLVAPLIGIGMGLLWAYERAPGPRAGWFALGALGVTQGLGGMLFGDQKLYGGAAWLDMLYPDYFYGGVGTRMLGQLWLLLGAAVTVVFMARRLHRLAWCLSLPLAVAIGAAWALNSREPDVHVNPGLTPELISLLRNPGPMDNTFLRRIKLYRWLREVYPEVRARVAEIPATMPAEHPDLHPPEGSVHHDPSAEDAFCVQLDRDQPLAGYHLRTFVEGRYRADFIVRRLDTSAEGRLLLAVTAGRSQSDVLGSREISLDQIPETWTTFSAPFELPQPDRFIGAQARLKGAGAIAWDTLRWVWLPDR